VGIGKKLPLGTTFPVRFRFFSAPLIKRRAMPFDELASRVEASSQGSHRWECDLDDARHGSREAQARLLEAVRPYLLAVAEDQLASDLRPKLAASDIVQNTVWQAWQDFGQFQGQTRAELVAWLRTILGHCAAAGARQHRSTGKRELSRERHLDQAASEFEEALADSHTSPSGLAMKNEQRQHVERAVRRLTPRHEQAIRLRNDLGLSFAEMGVALSCSEDAARLRWVRAVEKLGQELRRDEFENH
jgi:RNA polymerase sigma-70 factor (subfamily 1)